MPTIAARTTNGSVLPSSTINNHATLIDRSAVMCTVRTTGPADLQANTDYVVSWGAKDKDSGVDLAIGGMFDLASPTMLVCRLASTYLPVMQVRFAPVTTGAPYNTGERACKVLVNGTTVTAARASGKQAASVSGEGTTLNIVGKPIDLSPGDWVFGNVWTSAGPITALQTDFGGTFLSLIRLSDL